MILPLLAMHDEYKMRASRHKLSYETWAIKSESSSPSQLILVAVEACAWDALRVYVDTLIRTGRLARIVVDEAHLLLQHASFRPCLDMLEYFGRMPTSILLMTATCPRPLERNLFDKVGRQVYQVLRQCTDRPEIAQKMIPLPAADIEKVVAQKISSLTRDLERTDRALLFCLSRDECDRMAMLLKWKPYHSGISLEDRAESKKQWHRGEDVGLVCSSMLNCCLDYPSVRFVFHLGPPRDATDYYQAIGRCARDGKPGHAITYFHPGDLKKFRGDDWFGANAIYDMFCDHTICRRICLGIFFDGTSLPCPMIPGAQLCDVCDTQLSQAPPKTGPARFPSYLIPESNDAVFLAIRRDVVEDRSCGPSRMSTTHISASLPSPGNVETVTPSFTLNNPSNHPAPSATFGNHFSAAHASTKCNVMKPSEQHLQQIHMSCQILANCCPYCWSQDLPYDTHRLRECPYYVNERSQLWRSWKKLLRLPAGCCFFCGCPSKVSWSHIVQLQWFTYADSDDIRFRW